MFLVTGIFGQNKKDPKDRIRELQRKLRHETNGIKRQINRMDMEEEKVKRQIKDAAKKNQKDVCMVLAKGLVQSKKTKNRMHMSVTQINSIMMHMQHQLSTMRMAGAIQQSTDVMRSMQQLIKILWEVTQGELGKAPTAIRDDLGTSAQTERANAEAEEMLAKLQSSSH
ncbi:hypothetical protein M3Y99_00194900 [Aphelenchoides fujianensis]|nr:hypothetical protein M3Y99_00194900 [Aphelenchoides fujianensis]